MRIRDCMTEHPHSIRVNQPLSKAQEMMEQYSIRHLPVLKAGQLLGMLSQRDIYLINTYADSEDLIVEDAMVQEVYCVSPDASVNQVASHMAEHKLGSAVVMDQTGVIGIFTSVDAMRVLSEQF